MKEQKSISVQINDKIKDSEIEKDMLLLNVNNEYSMGINLVHDFVIRHSKIDLLPYWIKERRTIKGINEIDDQNSNFTLYDKEGNKLFSQQAEDAYIIESNLYNKFLLLY